MQETQENEKNMGENTRKTWGKVKKSHVTKHHDNKQEKTWVKKTKKGTIEYYYCLIPQRTKMKVVLYGLLLEWPYKRRQNVEDES